MFSDTGLRTGFTCQGPFPHAQELREDVLCPAACAGILAPVGLGLVLEEECRSGLHWHLSTVIYLLFPYVHRVTSLNTAACCASPE